LCVTEARNVLPNQRKQVVGPSRILPCTHWCHCVALFYFKCFN